MTVQTYTAASLATATVVADSAKVSKRSLRAAIAQKVNLNVNKVVHNTTCIFVDIPDGKFRQNGDGRIARTFGDTELEYRFSVDVELKRVAQDDGKVVDINLAYLNVTLTAKSGLAFETLAAASTADYVEDVSVIYSELIRSLGYRVVEENPDDLDIEQAKVKAAEFAAPFIAALEPYMPKILSAAKGNRPNLRTATVAAADDEPQEPAKVSAGATRGK